MNKAIKIIIISTGVLLAAAVIGIIVFIKNFDLNAYLPQITRDISAAIGRPVTVGSGTLNISLDGVTLDVAGITVAGDTPGAAPLLAGERLHAQVFLIPLLLQHKIHSNGIRISGIRSDVAGDQPVHIDVPQLQVQFGTIGLNESFPVTVDAQFASGVRNLHATAQVRWDTAASKAIIEDFIFRTDLSQLDLAQVKGITPSLAQALLPTSMAGTVTVRVPHVEAGAKGVEGLKAHLELSDGNLAVKELPGPVTGIRAAAEVDLSDAYLKEFALTLADGTVKGEGELRDYLKSARLSLHMAAEGINIEGLTDVNALPVVVKGRLAGRMDVTSAGLAPEAFMKSLQGEGALHITGGSIEKLNILTTVLGSTFKVIPGLAQALDTMITGSLKDKLGSDSTSLQKAEAKFSIAEQIAHLDSATVLTPAFEANATGTVAFDMKTDIQVVFLLDQVLSADLAKKVPQMAYLYDADKQHIKITGQLAGKAPDVKFNPAVEVKNVMHNAVVEEGGKQLQRVIEKNPEVGNVLNAIFGGQQQTNAASTQDTTGTAQQDAQTTDGEKNKALINNVLNGLFK